MKRAFFCLLGASLLSLSGCGDGDNPPRVEPLTLPAKTPLPECPVANYASCDIRESACQRQLSELAACMRQSEPLDAPMDVITANAYRELLREALANEDKSKTERMTYALSVLKLAPPGNVADADRLDERVRNTGGYYTPSQKRITIVDHGTPADSAGNDTVLVHELVHALQDVDYDFATWPSSDAAQSFDARLARSTLVEGEASFYQYRAAVPLFGLDIGSIDFEATLQQHLIKSFERALSADYLLPQSFSSISYGLGAQLAYASWKIGGPRAIDALWATPPSTMQAVLSELFGLNEPQTAGISLALPSIDSLTLDSSEVLGAWGLYLILTQAGQADALANALTWRGDQLSIYADAAEPSTSVLWQLELESAAAASFYQGFFARRTGILRCRATGQRVYVAYGSGPFPSELTDFAEAWLAE